MSSIELAPETREGFDRILEHRNNFDAAEPSARIQESVHGISILEQNRLIGRPIHDGLSELVIGRGAQGYIGLYRYVPEIDTVFLLAIRSQRETRCSLL